jgi:2'-5' RNA ligase
MSRAALRLFVAVDLPASVREAIVAATSPLLLALPDLRWTAPENLHCTLVFLGDVDPDAVPVLRDRLSAAAVSVEPFETRVDGFGRFPARGAARVVWAGLDDPLATMGALAGAVGHHTTDLVATKDRPFTAHVTVARARRPVRISPQLLETAIDARAFPVTEITLYRSHLGGAGPHPRYEALGTWGLGSRSVSVP